MQIGLQTARGLAAAHAQGLIHRDIKPANLLLEEDSDRVRITDFGLARAADDVGMTQEGVVAGTPEYMAPEQARGEPIDHRCDLFSLGAVLYAMCTGHPPFRASTTLAVLRQVSEADPEPIHRINPDISPWLEAFIARLMTKDPAGRFHSAAEVVALLERYQDHLNQPAAVPEPPDFPGKDAGLSATLWTQPRRRFTTFAVLLMLIGISVWLFNALQPESPKGEDNPPAAPGKEGHQRKQEHLAIDFRLGLDKLPAIRLFGAEVESVAKTEPEGLRFNQVGGRDNVDLLGVEMLYPLRGDFDIALSYELLGVGTPLPKYGAGVVLRIWFGENAELSAMIAQMRMPHGERFGAHKIVKGDDGQDKYVEYRDLNSTRPRGILRLVRTGARLRYLAADEGQSFREFHSTHFGNDDVTKVNVECASMYSSVALDIRLSRLEIHADRILNHTQSPALTPELPSVEEENEKAVPKGWWVAAVLIVLPVSVAIVVVAAWASRRRNRPEDGNPGIVSFACPGCTRTIRARVQLAGKNGKCRFCGLVVQIPPGETV